MVGGLAQCIPNLLALIQAICILSIKCNWYLSLELLLHVYIVLEFQRAAVAVALFILGSSEPCKHNGSMQRLLLDISQGDHIGHGNVDDWGSVGTRRSKVTREREESIFHQQIVISPSPHGLSKQCRQISLITSQLSGLSLPRHSHYCS